MKNQQEVQLVEVSEIQRRIISVRSVQVMLDRDLAELYGVELKALNQAVKRNAERFPEHQDCSSWYRLCGPVYRNTSFTES